jgi:transcriptional regulator with XRE-family HTH domain
MIHLADYMSANNLSDDDVAAALGRTRATISRIRRRKTRPDWETINKIKQFTMGQVTADDFLTLAPKASAEAAP